MSFLSNSSEFFLPLTNVNAATGHESCQWQILGAELVFVQDSSLLYHSFYWQLAGNYGLRQETIVGSYAHQVFIPTAQEAYAEKIRWVLEAGVPARCHWLFNYQVHFLAFELVISPILPPQGNAKAVLIMGRRASATELQENPCSSKERVFYQKLLSDIARKIRHTLDLETIWLQTAESLGKALNVSRCQILAYDAQNQQLDIRSEYCQLPCKSMLGTRLSLKSEPYWQQAILSGELIWFDQLQCDRFEQKSVLVVATYYKNQCNGLISLGQCDRYRVWSQAERELVQELADQVGTAIAHATLYQELERATLVAEETSRLKSEFLASTTHELRTPLNGILGFLKLVLDGMADDPQEQHDFLDQAYHSALHLLNLINDILDIAKIEAGKLELEFTAVSLNELFQEVESFTRTQAEEKHLYFKLSLPSTYDQIVVYGNYQRLLQVMLNLVGNAIKFTHEGGIIVNAEIVKKRVRRHNQEFPGIVKISVADTGIGVPLDKQDKLFENFVQVNGSRTKAYGGTGLGLAISQKLVEAMGGKISFYSMGEGLGSTVTFTVLLNQLPIIKTIAARSSNKNKALSSW